RPASQIRFNHFNSLCGIKLRAQEVAVSTLDPLYLIAGEPVPAETNRIRSIAPRMVAYCSSIGQGVFHHNRRCSYECFAPYTADLVNAGISPERGMILHNNVPRKRRAIRENHVAANPAIMGYVGLSHEKV